MNLPQRGYHPSFLHHFQPFFFPAIYMFTSFFTFPTRFPKTSFLSSVVQWADAATSASRASSFWCWVPTPLLAVRMYKSNFHQFRGKFRKWIPPKFHSSQRTLADSVYLSDIAWESAAFSEKFFVQSEWCPYSVKCTMPSTKALTDTGMVSEGSGVEKVGPPPI